MLDPKKFDKDFDEVVRRLATRGGNLDLGDFRALMAERSAVYVSLESLQAKRNASNEEMKRVAKQDPAALERLRGDLRALGQDIKDLEKKRDSIDERFQSVLLTLPNVPDPSVPVGASAEENVVVRTWGEAPRFPFTPRQHFEIGEKLGLLDFERAAKVSGSRFVFYRGDLARLERALAAYMIDVHTSRGYSEVLPPYLVNRAAMTVTGQLPKFEEDAFKTAGPDERFLIPTAEVPVTNYHADEILDGDRLPLRYCAFSPCFRAEAGAAGKDTRGLIRMHQFHKVELVKFAKPEQSMEALEQMVDDATEVLRRLGLHHRVVLLCTGDMGFASTKTYDLEVWLPGAGQFREISSCSNCGDFQARRGKIRFRPAAGEKPQLCHTLNGSGLAVGRTLVALLENGQREDGTVRLPDVLGPYMGGRTELRSA
jgi:seryl-tRNA synthetase